ncbi:MAG: hypothetical protein COA45_05035 [Zetaproteobacteria bacterium]|nr:MAG: hypothetical protein COA45_05035 [Zetaproteobacteria bacterium]
MMMRSHWFKYLCFICSVLILVGGRTSVYAQYPGFDAPGSRVSGGGAIGLVPVDADIDGGTIPLGASTQVVVLFRNEGARPVETGKINLYPSSNVATKISLNQCSLDALPSGAECAIAISVKGLQAGAWRLEMLMLHSGRTRLVTATVSGSVEANGDSSDKLSSDIEAIPSELDFGSLASGQALVEPVVLRNITSNPITISDIFINASAHSGFIVDADCKELQAGEACIATVTWSPQQKGPATGVFVVKHSGSTGVASVPLSGDYTPDGVDEAEIFPDAVPGKGLLVSSQVEIAFGDGVSSTATITVSLVNIGDSALTLNDIKLSGSDNGLSVSTNGCVSGLVLEPIEACPLILTWSPTRVGSLLDDVQVLHDGARGVLVIPVRGDADAVVSQNQKAIILAAASPTRVIGSGDVTVQPKGKNVRSSAWQNPKSPQTVATVNVASALDGLRITSFAATRAIVNGPGGSRLIYDNEQIMLGGVVWDVDIQRNGIEFSNGADRILLLFDRSLSSLNRITSQSLSSARSGNANSSN